MGNQLFVQHEDPNSYPIVERQFRKAVGYSPTTVESSQIDESRILQVMSYNLLADRLALPRIFTESSPAILSFQFRGPRILAEIRGSGADILCLQEVDRVSDYYNEVLTALGYKLIHYGRPGILRGEGVAIAYNIEKFKLQLVEKIDFDDLAKIYPAGGQFRRANQAMLCLFETKTNGRKFVAGTCHLHFNPKFDFVKHAQALYLKERASLFLQKHGLELPLFIGGDYNSEPVSSVMSVLHSEDILTSFDPVNQPSQWRIPNDCQEGVKEYYHLTNQLYRMKSSDGFLSPLLQNFQSAYNQYCDPIENLQELVTRKNQQPPYTNYTVSFKGALDHIMHNSKLQVLELLELPKTEDIESGGSCPNKSFPSDHLRIEAKFYMK